MDDYTGWTDRLLASDRQAFAELFEALHHPLLRYANRLITDEDAVYDVVQDAFIKLWSIRASLDREKSIRALMYTIVRNRCLNHLRWVKTRQATLTKMSTETIVTEQGTEERIDAEDLAGRIREWIAELPPKRREAFELSRFEGLSHKEIADVMDVTPRTATNHVMLALQHLRDRLRSFQTERGVV